MVEGAFTADQGRIKDGVFERLRAEILSGEIPPGSRLSVPEIASEFNVSRSPVREAVQQLTMERLAREIPRRGCFVIQLDPDELFPLYDVREVLEGLAARRAAESHDAVFRNELSTLMEDHHAAVKVGDIDLHTSLDVAFHKLLAEKANNVLLNDILDSIGSIVQLTIRTTSQFRTGTGNLALKEHDQIFEAILGHEPKRLNSKRVFILSRLKRDYISSWVKRVAKIRWWRSERYSWNKCPRPFFIAPTTRADRNLCERITCQGS